MKEDQTVRTTGAVLSVAGPRVGQLLMKRDLGIPGAVLCGDWHNSFV